MKRGNSFGDWFFLTCLLGAIIMLLLKLGDMKQKPNNFQSWSWSTIDCCTHIVREI
jgi:hypothetical protein